MERPSQLNIPKHIQYWKRCLKTYLPNAYQSNDANRMMLAFFIISSMDLLKCLDSSVTQEDRDRYIDWVYLCQHADGGFRGFPGGDMGELRNKENSIWDPANVPATFFALAILAILKDDFSRVRRGECLLWLTKMQRPDGSFGETLGGGKIEGGLDPRFGYLAMGIRAILRGRNQGELEDVLDLDIEAFVECIRRSQCYDGGFSESPFHEPHGGYTYCALSALSFVERLASTTKTTLSFPPSTAIKDPELMIYWLISRQTTIFDEEDDYEDDTETSAAGHDAHSLEFTTAKELQWIGFNGRCNKVADTCYSWWVIGSLDLLGKQNLANPGANRRYLLDKTQHLIGGFGKKEGNPPDIYHAYLGLAALSLMGEEGLKPIDATACFSIEAWEWIQGLPWNGGEIGRKEKKLELEDNSYIGMSGG